MDKLDGLSMQKIDGMMEEHLQRAHTLFSELEALLFSTGSMATEDEVMKIGSRLVSLASSDFFETQKSLSELRALFLNDSIFSHLKSRFDDS